MRNEIEMQHLQITPFDMPHLYDTGVFNECERMGYMTKTLHIWKDVHPSIVTIPMEGNYKIPYGIVYVKNHLNLCRHLSKRFKVI